MSRRRLALGAATLVTLATVGILASAGAPRARAGDDKTPGPLDRAERMEAEGRALLERGERVAGAKHMAEAWMLRARAWAEEGERMLGAEIDALRAKSAAVEQEAHALREAGKKDEAEAKIQESARLWKDAEALAARARERAEAAWPDARGKDDAQALEVRGKRLEARLGELEAKAADLWAAGKLEAAEATYEEARGLRAQAKEVRRAREKLAKSASGATDAGSTAATPEVAALAEQVEALRRQVKELRTVLEAVRQKLGGEPAK